MTPDYRIPSGPSSSVTATGLHTQHHALVSLHGNRGLTVGFLHGIIAHMTHPLRTYRHKVGITLEALAHRVGATKATLSRIECGQRLPSIGLVSRIVAESEGLLRADDFLPREETPSAKFTPTQAELTT